MCSLCFVAAMAENSKPLLTRKEVIYNNALTIIRARTAAENKVGENNANTLNVDKRVNRRLFFNDAKVTSTPDASRKVGLCYE